MRIGILGLAGDPPHNGHKAVMDYAAPFVEEVWLMPCYLHKFKKPIASPEHRLWMCSLVGKTSAYEIATKCYGYTIDLVSSLKIYFPQHEFSFIIGQDNANYINHWVKWEELIKSTKFIVIPRGDREVLNDWYLKDNHIYGKDFFGPETSSTDIRKLLADKDYEAAKKHLSPHVWEYIQEKELYVSPSVFPSGQS